MHLFRTRFKKDIVAEFLPPKKNSNKVVILCDGMPSLPHKKKLIEFLHKKNFWIFHPRYRGTWESSGSFLDHSPHEDILDIIDELPKGFKSIWDYMEYKIKPDRIFVFGASFGGPAAILSTLDKRVTKAIAFSPVVDWSKEQDSPAEPMDKLEKIVREAFGEAYRFRHEDWKRLSRGEFYNPVNYINKLDPNKIMIVHAQDDEVVLPEPVEKFTKDIGCKFFLLKKGGHFSSAKAMQWKMWRKIKKFLNS